MIRPQFFFDAPCEKGSLCFNIFLKFFVFILTPLVLLSESLKMLGKLSSFRPLSTSFRELLKMIWVLEKSKMDYKIDRFVSLLKNMKEVHEVLQLCGDFDTAAGLPRCGSKIFTWYGCGFETVERSEATGLCSHFAFQKKQAIWIVLRPWNCRCLETLFVREVERN